MDPRAQSRFLNLVRAIAANLAALLRTRLELFAVELQEEKARAIRVLVWLCAGVLTGGMGFLLLNVTLVYLAPENTRGLVLALLTVVYLVVFLVIVLVLRDKLKAKWAPFRRTVAEFRKDGQWLTKDDKNI